MKRLAPFVLALTILVPDATGQTASDVRDRMMGHFSSSIRKVVQLSEVMPQELYTWAPQEGIMTVAEVYAHIARYNYMYLEDQLGISVPDDLDLDTMEALTDKEAVRDVLVRSVDHVREHVLALTEEQLDAKTTLYGREVHGWEVLTQLVAHMNEHVGQSVSYARMNGIVPPWSS